MGSGEVRVAGEGDGQVREVIRELHFDGFTGFFSIEPHLGSFDAFGGQCGPDPGERPTRVSCPSSTTKAWSTDEHPTHAAPCCQPMAYWMRGGRIDRS